ncbi:MAG: shikimate dehydrogenase [Bacteroidales bacterium]|nr:shikimate dehydrogenase [Bacteroidales bacterium]
MELYGLLGKTLKHSFSGDYFGKKFAKKGIKAEYHLFEFDEVPDLHAFAKDNPSLKGFNVTIPYKRTVVAQLDEMSNLVRMTGNANVVKVVRKNGNIKLVGYNTDATGFEKSLEPLVKKRNNLRALILGTGGAAHTVAFVLRKMGIYFYFVTRNPYKVEMIGYSFITPEIINECQLIVNTTPVGMFPEMDACPNIPYENLDSSHILYDLVYNPPETLFLKKGKEKGATIKNGQEMLQIQAEESWKIWNNKSGF